MPVVEVYGTQRLRAIARREVKSAVRHALVEVKALGLTHQSRVSVRFPSEQASGANETDVTFRISILEKPGRTPEIRGRMVRAVGEALRPFFPAGTFIGGWPVHAIKREEYWRSDA